MLLFIQLLKIIGLYLSDVAFYPAIEDYWFIFLFDLII
jgi:hypothetical protein